MFSLYQFWYVHIVTHSNLVQRHSINLLLVSSKQKEQLFLIHCQFYYCNNQKQEELAMFSHTNISVQQLKTFGWTIMEIFVGKMFYYIMNCRINWSWNKRGVLLVFNSPHISFRGYLGPKITKSGISH